MTQTKLSGETVLAGVRKLPGGPELLELAHGRGDVALVGGSVRDLLLGPVTPRELDVTVDRDAAGLAAELAARLPGNEARIPETTVHERFGTAVVDWIDAHIDIAERRAESYARPGALPDVRPGSITEDLARRDFTVNAIAVALGGPQRGGLHAVEHALEDLAAGSLRVLHEASFSDDPTRLLRLGRYRARLGFEVEPHTARLAAEALASGALDTVSGGRIAAELWLATEESDPAASFTSLGELGVLAALSLPPSFDAQLLREATSLMPPDGVSGVLEMAVLFHPAEQPSEQTRRAASSLMERFEFLADTRQHVLAAAFDSSALAAEIEHAQRPSELRRVLAGRPVEAVAIAGALGGGRSPEIPRRARTWLSELREVKLTIGGADLLAAGIPEGPEIGRRLEAVLDMRLDGELTDAREAQLLAALGERA